MRRGGGGWRGFKGEREGGGERVSAGESSFDTHFTTECLRDINSIIPTDILLISI